MKAHGSSFPLRVKDSSVAAGILENVCSFGAELFVGRGKGLVGVEAPVRGFVGGLGFGLERWTSNRIFMMRGTLRESLLPTKISR